MAFWQIFFNIKCKIPIKAETDNVFKMDTAEFGAIGISGELPSSLLHPEYPQTLQYVEFEHFDSASDKQPREILESSDKAKKGIKKNYFNSLQYCY